MTKLIAATKIAAIALLAVLLSLLFSELCSERFTEIAEGYPCDSTSFTLRDVAQDRQAAALASLTDYAAEHGALLVRADQMLSRGMVVGTRLGVAGSPLGQGRDATLDFMGADVLDAARLERLMSSASPAATLGLSESRTDMIEDLPSFVLGNRLVVEKLSHLVEESGTANGTYRVSGLGSEQVSELAERVATASGISADRVLNPLSGHVNKSVIVYIVPPIAAGAIVLLLALFVVSGLRDLPTLGVCVTCGWGRMEFAFDRCWRWLAISLIALPVSWAVGAWATGGALLSWGFLSFMGAAGLLTVLAVALSAIAAALLAFRVPAGDAIRGRVSRRLIVAVLLIAYIGAAVFADACGFILDVPVREMRANAEIARQWGGVSNLNVLERMTADRDAASISGQSNELSRKFYGWYSSIAERDGVYLVKTQYMSDSILDVIRGADQTRDTPTSPFRLYTASPSYLASQGFSVDPALIAAAHAGTRVYLLPDTMSADERARIESYARRSDSTDVDDPSTIQTAFNATRSFSFTTYAPRTELFSWETDTSLPQTTRDAVICLCVPENMVFIEDESLWASGLANGYVKLTDQAAAAYLSPSYLSRFELDGDDPVFVSTAEFVAGIQKTLSETLTLYGGVTALAVAVMIAMVLGLTAAYQIAYREEVAVKRLMGFSTRSVYRLPFAIVTAVFLAGEVAAALMRSQLGAVLVAVLLALQMTVLAGYVRATESRQINRMLKE